MYFSETGQQWLTGNVLVWLLDECLCLIFSMNSYIRGGVCVMTKYKCITPQ